MLNTLLFTSCLLFSSSLLAISNTAMPKTIDGCAQSIRNALMSKAQAATQGTNTVSLAATDIPSNCQEIPIPSSFLKSQRPAPADSMPTAQ